MGGTHSDGLKPLLLGRSVCRQDPAYRRQSQILYRVADERPPLSLDSLSVGSLALSEALGWRQEKGALGLGHEGYTGVHQAAKLKRGVASEDRLEDLSK